MAIGDKTYPWAAHTAWGKYDNLQQNVIEHIFGYTWHKKKVSLGTAAAVLASTAGTTSQQVITAGITSPDVPRVLAITIGGSGMSAGSIVLTGVNVEGKTITDSIAFTTTGQVNGVLVFKRLTSVTIPAALSATGTVTVDTTNKIGLNHRIPVNRGTIVEVIEARTSPYNSSTSFVKPTVAAAPSASNEDGEFVEKNWVTSATAYDGTTTRVYYYWFHKVLIYPPKDSPEFYSTTTSTSTSTSSTSTSSTSLSTSTSISSTSTSSTSTSTSSTSTSTTTLPV